MKKCKKCEEARELIKNLIVQFGYRDVKNGKPVLHSGGIATLEWAFKFVGWSDPYFVPPNLERFIFCNVKGCLEPAAGGTSWGDKYVFLCSKHFDHYLKNKKGLPLKKFEIKQENKK